MLKWYTKAANQGDLVAQMRLGFVHYRGDRVPKDTKKAAKWFAKAAAAGDAEAQRLLAGMYYHGTRGVHQNQSKALKWYQRAAKSPAQRSGQRNAGQLSSTPAPRTDPRLDMRQVSE